MDDKINLKKRMVTINYAYRCHKQAARLQGFLPLSREIWDKIVFDPCFYCGDVDERIFFDSPKRIDFDGYHVKINGIDRINSNLGYLKENSVSCCKMCNSMKSDYPQEHFLSHVSYVFNNLVRFNKIDL